MNYFKLPEGVCPITGWKFFTGPKDHGKYKKQKREAYHKGKAKQSVIVAMYGRELNLTIVQ